MVAQQKALGPDLEPLEVVPQESPAELPFARLKALHDEATETAHLANLLGRALYTGMLLPALALAAVVLFNPPLARGANFLVLVLMGASALVYARAKALHAPFEHASLKRFAADLDAILLYAGFAWGAGAFLILPAKTDPAIATLFSACTAAIVAMIVRSRSSVIMFAVPVGLLTALAAMSRPLELPSVTAALAATTCFLVAVGVALSSWMKVRNAQSAAPIDAYTA